MPKRAAREHDALVVEAAHQHGRALVDLAEHVVCGHLTVLEDQLAGVGAAHAELVQLLRGAKPVHAALDQERRDAARAGRGIGLGVDHQHLGVGAVGDPHLGSVQDVAVALLLGAGPHADHVRAGAGLAHGQRAHVLAADQLRQIALLLRVAAVAPDLIDAEVRMRPVAQADRGRRARDFLHGDDVLGVAQAAAAVFLLDRDPVQAERAQARPQIARELIGPVDRLGARRDLGLREAGDRIADHVRGFAEIEVERRKAELRHGCPLRAEARWRCRGR